MKKQIRISVRASDELKQRLKAASDLTGINETNLVISCVEALIEYIETHGEIRMPLAVIPRSELNQETTTPIRKTA